MSAEVTTTFDPNGEYGKVITVKHGPISINEWAATTLSAEENAEWLRQDKIHEDAVKAAIAAGDCELVQHDHQNANIKWRSTEIHEKWMNTISQEDHRIYSDFWSRYQKAMEER